MTKEEFEAGYCEGHNITKSVYNKQFETFSCTCGCGGWVVVKRDDIKDYRVQGRVKKDEWLVL